MKYFYKKVVFGNIFIKDFVNSFIEIFLYSSLFKNLSKNSFFTFNNITKLELERKSKLELKLERNSKIIK